MVFFFVVISWGKIIKKKLRPFIIFEAMCFSRESSTMENSLESDEM